ncbi:MAG: radical SAM protein [Pseudomonadota bacterium]
MRESDKYKIDSHKLMYHPKMVTGWLDSVDDWEKAKKVYPIYMEISPVGYCNHRCTFCALDFMEYANSKLDPQVLKERLKEMAPLGVKSVMFAGEGEPTLYKELPEVLDLCTELGIDTSLTTNIVPFTEKNTDSFVRNCKWIKVSINAGTAERYAKIHRTDEKDFSKAIDNMKRCVALKKEKGYTCTLGGQILLVDDNYDTTVDLARLLKDIGFDYLVVKPYSQHLSSITTKYKDIDYSKYLYLNDELEKFNSRDFKVIFRLDTMNKLLVHPDRYQKCNAVPFFWAYIMANGDVYGCSAFLGDKNFMYGNIHQNSFKEIWEGEKRRQGYVYTKEKLNIDECRINCRMDEVNRYLWELVNPSHHVNFI